MIYLGIDDTDIVGSPGTNQLARAIVARLGSAARGAIVCRHQLFFDPRVPYTSQNGSASIQLPFAGLKRDALVAMVRDVMLGWYIEGSDPGLAVTDTVSSDMMTFATRAQSDIVTQDEARDVARRAACHLEGLGGTNQGIIGALAAVALSAGGEDGRVVHVESWPWPDALVGVQPVTAIRERGITDIRTATGTPFTGDEIDVGRHLRPNWRGGRIVLFVEQQDDGTWRARKLH